MWREKYYWRNKDNVIKESKKYNNRTDFRRKSHGAYESAKKMGLLDEMVWLSCHNRKPRGYWKVKENVMNEAKKYKTKAEFAKNNQSAFISAYKCGYIDEMYWLVTQKQHKKKYWNYSTIEKEALKYKTKSEFKKKSPSAYNHALKLGIIDDFFLNNYIEY